MTTATENRYIVREQPFWEGSQSSANRTPVRAVVELWRLGIFPEEVPTDSADLTLAQVFDALSYFSDHQDEIAAYIEQNRVPEENIDSRVKDR